MKSGILESFVTKQKTARGAQPSDPSRGARSLQPSYITVPNTFYCLERQLGTGNHGPESTSHGVHRPPWVKAGAVIYCHLGSAQLTRVSGATLASGVTVRFLEVEERRFGMIPTDSGYKYKALPSGEIERDPSDVDYDPDAKPKAPYFGMTGTKLNAWVTVACTTAMTLFGYDQGVFGGIIVTRDFLQTVGNPNPNLQGTIVSLYDIGCFFGAMAAFVIGEALGRKKTFMIGVTIMSIGAILQASSFSVAQLIVARLVTGVGNGMNTATAPVWQSETSKPNLRGKMVVFGMIMNIAGFSLSNWMTYGFSFLSGSIAWRFPIAFQILFSFILFATVPWLPESPRWLLAHGREEEGVAVLVALEGNGVTADDEIIVSEKEEIVEALRIERETLSPSWSDILHGKTGNTGMMRRLILGAGTQWMQQLVGVNVTSYYLPLVLQNSVGLSNNLARLLAACNSTSYLVFAFFGLILIETAGRRKLMMWGAAGQFVCYACISGLLSHDGDPSGKKYGAAATAFFFLYYVFFGICWQGVPWLYPTEINSLSMRTKGAALATASNWISNYVVVQVTPPGIASLGWRFYLIWMVFNAVFVPLVWAVYPETANRHLEDIDKLYRENDSMILVFRNKEAIQVERPQRFIDAEEERLAAARQVAGSDLDTRDGIRLGRSV